MGSHHSKRRSPTESIHSKLSEISLESKDKTGSQQKEPSSIESFGFKLESQNSVETPSKMSDPQLQLMQMLSPLKTALSKLSEEDPEAQSQSMQILKPLISIIEKLSIENCDEENGNPKELKPEEKGPEPSKISIPIRKPVPSNQNSPNPHDTSVNHSSGPVSNKNLSSKISKGKTQVNRKTSRRATTVRVTKKASKARTVSFNGVGISSTVLMEDTCAGQDSIQRTSPGISRPRTQCSQWVRLACAPQAPYTAPDPDLSEQFQYREQYEVPNSKNYDQVDSDEEDTVQEKQIRGVNSPNAFNEVRPTTTSSRPGTSAFRPTTSGYQRLPTSLPEIILGATKTTRILTRRIPKSEAIAFSSRMGQYQYPTYSCPYPYPYQSYPYSQGYSQFPPFACYPYQYPYGGYPNYGYYSCYY